jgi:hypothetical protein
LAADLNDGLKRLKMAAMRRIAPELPDGTECQRRLKSEQVSTAEN